MLLYRLHFLTLSWVVATPSALKVQHPIYRNTGCLSLIITYYYVRYYILCADSSLLCCPLHLISIYRMIL